MSGVVQVRRRAVYAGRVQGVGFRATTVGVARRFAVGGWVRNLPDGCVELVAEGTEAEVARFLQGVAGALASNIATTTVAEESPTGEFTGFGVAR